MSVLILGADMPEDCLHCFMKHLVRGKKIIAGSAHDMWYADCKGAFIETVYNYVTTPVRVEGIRCDCPLIEIKEGVHFGINDGVLHTFVPKAQGGKSMRIDIENRGGGDHAEEV